MALFLLYLLLVPLALPPVLSKGTYAKFVKQHTFKGNVLPECTAHMNSVLKALNMPCKPCNSIILGDNGYNTDRNEVDQVCSGKTNGDYTSPNKFRVLKCSLIAGDQPPNCKYKKMGEKDIMKKKILLTCENQKPVHFNPC